MSRKKNEGKRTEPMRYVTYHQVYQYIHNENSKGKKKKKGAERIYEETTS